MNLFYLQIKLNSISACLSARIYVLQPVIIYQYYFVYLGELNGFRGEGLARLGCVNAVHDFDAF